MDKTKSFTNELGTFVFTRAKQAEEFYCDRCDATKKAKNSTLWTQCNGRQLTLCNGCYGYVRAKGHD